MPHNIALITTIAVSLGLALAMGLIAVRLKLPALVGYLMAGVMIGPATPGFVANIELSSQLAEIGVMLLMFGVGLHFSLDDLLAVRRIAVPGAIAQISVATALGAGMAMGWGWSFGAGLVFGLALSVASTVVLLRALEQHGILQTVNGQIAVGWLVVEDLAMVLVLVVLPPLSGWLGGASSHAEPAADGDLLKTLLITLGEISLFIALMLFVGRRILPWLLWQVAGSGSRELFTLAVIAVAVGIAYGSAELFGVSFALGAFFAGMVLRESPLSHRAAQESLPFRDAFSVLFFVSVGMLFDPRVVIQQPLPLLGVVAIIVVGKSLAALLLVLALRYPLNTALTVAVSLAQIGEFSFILAGLGVALGILPREGQSLILAGAILSIAINPFVFQLVEPVQAWIRSRSRLARALERPADPLAELPMTVESHQVTGHVLLVGYGRVGRRIGEALTEQRLPLVVAEQNRDRVEQLRERGIHAVAGDASIPAVLIQAHVARAGVLVIATPDTVRVRRMIEIARALNPDIKTLVRTHSEEEAALLRKEQVGTVFLGEQELALSMIRHVLEHVAIRQGEHA
ncbi:MAG TPA: YbaL family putative K(+) efflux transporter [Candidatus Competibacteraceae bacterium]|nr:YbaL family putative K(+) efflux transporter [Candidatus Competibacteraceae bacterium]HRZ05178.1 YbaL family putative K(+) efflux transporter [Candidatus Competibacteraceae bacterium]HSA46822.1 YbaL family putative K(+) efflux transporter [Candidatus Competibacteraceae bacterium]